MKWKTILLHPDFKVIVQATKIQSTLKTKIETLWLEKKRIYPHLFNGRVFSANTLTSHRLTGYWTEYKNILAQMQNPEFYSILALRPLAVNGLIHCPEGFILGKRSQQAVYLPGSWQSPPAGSVESRYEETNVNLIQQLFAEAKEELGIDKEHFLNLKIVSATEHTHTHILDIGILLETTLSFSRIKKYWQNNANDEYSQITCLPITEPIPNSLLPTTKTLIKAWFDSYDLS